MACLSASNLLHPCIADKILFPIKYTINLLTLFPPFFTTKPFMESLIVTLVIITFYVLLIS